jgi:hypothetical protein
LFIDDMQWCLANQTRILYAKPDSKIEQSQKNEDCISGKMHDYRSISQQVKTPKTAENDRIQGFSVSLIYHNKCYRM